MKIATKLLLLLLTVLMCTSCFVACGGDDVTTTTPPAVEGSKVPGLENQTYSGKTCNIWHKKSSSFGPGESMYTDDPGVSAVARASTSRVETFEASTGVTLNFHESSNDGAPSGTADIAELRSLLGAASAGNVYDIVMPGGYASMVLASEGLFSNLATNPQINLDHPTWQKNINDNLSICGGYFAVAGLFTVRNIGETACIYFDKTALTNLTAPELLANTDAKDFVDDQTLYQWAKDGTWTYDKMLALAAAFTGENGKIAEPGVASESDEYGFEFQGTSSYTLFMATGKQYVGPNPAMQNIPTLKVGEPETVQVLNWLIDNIIEKPYCNDAGGGNGYDPAHPYYFGLSHQCLFEVNMVRTMSSHAQKGSEDGEEGFDFGILPMPKMDYTNFELSEQESYHGAHNAWFSTLAAIPKLANDLEFSGFVLETFTEMGYTKWNDDPTISTIWEAYIEDGLDGRYAPDTNDVDMLYLCLESATSDMGEFMVWKTSGIGNIGNAVRDRVRGSNKEWEVYASGIQAKVDAEVIEMLYAMDLIAR